MLTNVKDRDEPNNNRYLVGEAEGEIWPSKKISFVQSLLGTFTRLSAANLNAANVIYVAQLKAQSGEFATFD